MYNIYISKNTYRIQMAFCSRIKLRWTDSNYTVLSGIEILQAACEALNSTWIGVDRMPLDQKMRAIEARKTWRSKAHDVMLKKVTSELQVLQRFSDFAYQGVLQCRKASRNSSRDPCSFLQRHGFHDTLQGSLLGASFEAHLATRSMARNGWTIAVPL